MTSDELMDRTGRRIAGRGFLRVVVRLDPVEGPEWPAGDDRHDETRRWLAIVDAFNDGPDIAFSEYAYGATSGRAALNLALLTMI